MRIFITNHLRQKTQYGSQRPYGSIDAGGNVTISRANHIGGLTYGVSIKGNTDAAASGILIAELTTPSGVIQPFTLATATGISCTP